MRGFRGVVYLVNTANPQDCSPLTLSQSGNVRVVVPQSLLALAAFTSIQAIGRDGSVWKSERLCWDDLKIVEFREEILRGVGSEPPDAFNSEPEFVLDLKTGRALRTAYPAPWKNG